MDSSTVNKENQIETGVKLEKYEPNIEITWDFDKSLSVKCLNGIFVGKKNGEVLTFKGIPYAKPPIGNLRLKPPLKPENSTKVFTAYYFGKSSLQSECPSERASSYEQGEDCLTLNIYKNISSKTEKRAIMVFIHGGAFGWGGSSDPLYDGTNFVSVQKDIILVTINYRVGILGFINVSSLKGGEEYKESGNLGLLDQVRALEWIHENIINFGGDPENVTIFGESAGGTSVTVLPLIKGTKGLFHRVIAQSGSFQFTSSSETSKKISQKFFDEIKASSVDDIIKLKESDIKRIIDKYGDLYNLPERDGIILPKDFYECYDSYDLANIEYILGTNKDEYRYWIGEYGGLNQYKITMQNILEFILSNINEKDKHYIEDFIKLQKGDDIWNKTEFFNEIIFRIPSIIQAEKISIKGGKVYMYYWTYESSIENVKACHAVELSSVFNNLKNGIFTGGRVNEKLANTVQNIWANFAKSGNPNIKWKTYDTKERTCLILGEDIHEEVDLLSEQRKLMKPLAKYYINYIDPIE